MKRRSLFAAFALCVLAPLSANASGLATYQVSITNITPGTLFTPVLAVTHRNGSRLFHLGSSASNELAMLAEGGATAPLEALIRTQGRVRDTHTGSAPLLSGTEVSFTIKAKSNDRLSIAAMLLPTNDSFVGLDRVKLPYRGKVEYFAKAYDAGSELNDELCANIPGPQCGGSGAFTGINGEGYVHISRGITGIGDLSTHEYDWKNPVARIVIRKK